MTTRLHPDLGAFKAIPTGADDGDMLINAAGVAEIARRTGTAKGRAFYRAYVAMWRRTQGQPAAKGEREMQCMRAGIAAAATAPSEVPK